MPPRKHRPTTSPRVVSEAMVEPAAPHRGQSWVVAPGGEGGRLDAFLASSERLGSRGRAGRALERGQVFVNRREATPADAGQVLSRGDAVVVWLDRPGSARRRTRSIGPAADRVPILFDDDQLIVVNKPPGLLTVPLPGRAALPSVAAYLRSYLRSKGKRRPLVVHRIDRDTSGLVVFATDARPQAVLREQFRSHEPERVYLAIVRGTPSPASGSWRDRLAWDHARLMQTATRAGDPRGSEGLCHYRVVESLGDAALIEVRLVTGKRNQIRLQASLRGHPLFGERQYVSDDLVGGRVTCLRQALHAAKLSFTHPTSGRLLTFEAPLPPDMVVLLRTLRARGESAAGRSPEGPSSAPR